MLRIKRLEIQRLCDIIRVIKKKSLQLRKNFYQIGLLGNSWRVIDGERSTVDSITLRQIVLKGIGKLAECDPGEYAGRQLFLMMVSASALALTFLNDSLR